MRFKGTLDAKTLPLEWQATATGIEDKPSRHLFFTSKSKDGSWQVARALFIFSAGPKATIRLYGAYDANYNLARLAIASLLDPKSDIKGLKESLLANYQTASWGDFYSTVMLSTELDPKYGGDILQQTVAAKDDRFDLDLYARAVQSLASRQGAVGVKAILEGIPAVDQRQGVRRLPESMAFWAIGTYGKPDCIPTIRDFIKAHPAFVVSAAWALAEMGGTDAQALIKEWRKDPAFAAQMEKISQNDRGPSEVSVVDLLDQALAHMQTK